MDATRPALEKLDRALVDLRRFLTPPQALNTHGLDVELSTLLVLDGLPPAGETVRDVAARLDVAHSTASRLITRAERAGMTARSPHPHDARQTLVTPTSAGLELAAWATEFRLQRLTVIVGDWTADDVHGLADGLRRFADSYRARERHVPAAR